MNKTQREEHGNGKNTRPGVQVYLLDKKGMQLATETEQGERPDRQ